MNLFRFHMNWMVLCLLLFPFSLLAQVTSTEIPDTAWFTDITTKVGLGKYNTNYGACIAVDVNNDNYPDLIIVGGYQCDSCFALYINEERPGSTNPTDRIFVDSTATSGLNVKGVYKDLAGAGDFDNDGNVDIITTTWPIDNEASCNVYNDSAKQRIHIWWGDGHGHFTLDSLSNTPNNGLKAIGAMSGSSLPVLDYNRDGYLDIFAACDYESYCEPLIPNPSHLIKNNGDRTFTDVTNSMGINKSERDTISKPTYFYQYDNGADSFYYDPPTARGLFGANVFDYNNDCWPDIFTAPYEAIGYPFFIYNNESDNTNEDTSLDTRGYGNLYQNMGGNSFLDVGVRKNWVPHMAWSIQGIVPWAAMPADYNNDGNMDFLAVMVHGVNQDSSKKYDYPYEDVNLGLAGAGNGRTCIFTNLGPDSGYRFKFDIGRINRRNPSNVTHGDHNGIWTDFNNDGHQDLIIGDAAYDESGSGFPDYQRMFFELQDTTTHDFDDITQGLGFCDSTTGYIAHDIRRPSVMLPVDFDLDGDDDILRMPYSPGGTDNDSISFFRNNVGNKNHHITIKLVAPNKTVNGSCIGARIKVVAGNLKQTKEIYGDQGQFTTVYPFTQNFGLGQRTMVDSIIVRWPDNNCNQTIYTHVPADQFITIDTINDTASAVPTHIMPVGQYTPNNFKLYPNPDNGSNLNMVFEAPCNPFIEIYNELGEQVADYKPGYASSFSLPISNLPAGIYFVHIIGVPSSSVVTQPFMKTNPQ